MITFSVKHLALAFLFFIIELFIALFVRDAIIRPYGGDVLAVVFVYYLLRSFLKLNSTILACVSLLISFVVEAAQYFNVVSLLNWQHIKWVQIVIGSSFSWADVMCYCIGFLIICFAIPKQYK